MYKKIDNCRVCNLKNFISVINLGTQSLTGVFPATNEEVATTPVEVVRCTNPECGLIQLNHSYNTSEMYSDRYGYRSSLNNSMLSHLRGLYEELMAYQSGILSDNDLIIDIGSNDASFLNFFKESNKKLDLIGIDPVGNKYKEAYNNMTLIPEFFGSPEVTSKLQNKRAKIITSIAMFYDLEDPVTFAKQIEESLDGVYGIWCFEQAYTPETIKTNDFTVCCQEHCLFLTLNTVKNILDKTNLRIFDVSFNKSNGGSFRVFAASLFSSRFQPRMEKIEKILKDEKEFLDHKDTFTDFRGYVGIEKSKLLFLLKEIKNKGETILGLGASTKFNVLLQYYGITSDLLPAIGEVNTEKVGKTTPGTKIPIITEEEVFNKKPDYIIIGPYHFKDFFLNHDKIKEFRQAGGKVIFPLPCLEIL